MDTCRLDYAGKRIVCISLAGGLGNQLFKIATAYTYAKRYRGNLLLFCDSTNPRGYYWDTIYKALRAIITRHPPNLPQWTELFPTLYTPIPPLTDNGLFLDGFFQSPKYFDPSVREIFRAKGPLCDSICAKYRDLLESKDRIVVLHARQTDYLTPDNVAKYGSITMIDYELVMASVSIVIPDPIFVLVSDDASFWHKAGINGIIIEEDDVNTMILLQHLHNFMITNSTFAWWCAWLADWKYVWAPARWLANTSVDKYIDIYDPEWILY